MLIPSLKAAFDTTDVPVRISCAAMATMEAFLLVASMAIKLGMQACVCERERGGYTIWSRQSRVLFGAGVYTQSASDNFQLLLPNLSAISR
jgi:hypothetical protein